MNDIYLGEFEGIRVDLKFPNAKLNTGFILTYKDKVYTYLGGGDFDFQLKLFTRLPLEYPHFDYHYLVLFPSGAWALREKEWLENEHKYMSLWITFDLLAFKTFILSRKDIIDMLLLEDILE